MIWGYSVLAMIPADTRTKHDSMSGADLSHSYSRTIKAFLMNGAGSVELEESRQGHVI